MLQPSDFAWLVLRRRAVRRGLAEPLDADFLNDLKGALIDVSEVGNLMHSPEQAGYLR
jgi:hypothetical protein